MAHHIYTRKCAQEIKSKSDFLTKLNVSLERTIFFLNKERPSPLNQSNTSEFRDRALSVARN